MPLYWRGVFQMDRKETIFKGFKSPNYTQTPNEFYDDILLSKDITLAEIKILGFMIRYTYGWQRAGNSLQFSFSELQKACNLGREAVNNGLKKLLSKNYIQRKEINGHMKYRLHIKEISDYPWALEFNWKQVYKIDEEDVATIEKKEEFENRTQITSSKIEPKSVRKSNQDQFENRTDKSIQLLELQEEGMPVNKNINKEIKEEEELYNNEPKIIQSKLKILSKHLDENGFHKNQIQAILNLLIKREINTFTLKEINAQIQYMNDEMQKGRIEFHSVEGFAKYFVSGLENIIKQSKIVKHHERQKLLEEEAKKVRREKRDKSVYYNWLET